MPTLYEALNYLGIDYDDEMIAANVTRALATSEQVLRGAVGSDVETYLPGDPRVTELILIYLDDLYSNRGVTEKAGAKVSVATRRLVADMELQLKLDLRDAKEAAGA